MARTPAKSAPAKGAAAAPPKAVVGAGERSPSGFKIKDRISHPKFGNGVVMAVEGEKLTIQFPRKVTKQIVDYYVKPRH